MNNETTSIFTLLDPTLEMSGEIYSRFERLSDSLKGEVITDLERIIERKNSKFLETTTGEIFPSWEQAESFLIALKKHLLTGNDIPDLYDYLD